MTEASRISIDEARRDLASGKGALLVCAYDDESMCRAKHLEGAINMQQLNARLASLSKDAEIVFYCA